MAREKNKQGGYDWQNRESSGSRVLFFGAQHNFSLFYEDAGEPN
jgi:hypothetical protein